MKIIFFQKTDAVIIIVGMLKLKIILDMMEMVKK